MRLRIGEVGERTGLSARQLRAWESAGLVSSTRGTGNQRTYGEDDVATLLSAKRMRAAGLGLGEIKLALAIRGAQRLGIELEAVGQVLAVLGRMRIQLAVADEMATALRDRLARRGKPAGPTQRVES